MPLPAKYADIYTDWKTGMGYHALAAKYHLSYNGVVTALYRYKTAHGLMLECGGSLIKQ